MMNALIRPGDQVRLKSSSPSMTVEWVEAGVATCSWFAGSECRTEEFVTKALVVVARSDGGEDEGEDDDDDDDDDLYIDIIVDDEDDDLDEDDDDDEDAARLILAAEAAGPPGPLPPPFPVPHLGEPTPRPPMAPRVEPDERVIRCDATWESLLKAATPAATPEERVRAILGARGFGEWAIRVFVNSIKIIGQFDEDICSPALIDELRVAWGA
jgi:uncharacterized protein YodC (DUF2158 family)